MAKDKGTGSYGGDDERQADPTDPCANERRHLEALDAEIQQLLKDIGSGDFGADELQRMQRKLEADQLRRPQVEQLLNKCVEQHPSHKA